MDTADIANTNPKYFMMAWCFIRRPGSKLADEILNIHDDFIFRLTKYLKAHLDGNCEYISSDLPDLRETNENVVRYLNIPILGFIKTNTDTTEEQLRQYIIYFLDNDSEYGDYEKIGYPISCYIAATESIEPITR